MARQRPTSRGPRDIVTPKTLDEVYALFPRLAERRRQAGYVIENGRIVMTGTGAELLDDPQIKVAYLGL